MVRRAVLTPQRDQDGRVRRHGSSTGRGPRFFHTVMHRAVRDRTHAGRRRPGSRSSYGAPLRSTTSL
eukprot:5955011-Prymnesium_polylepis.1